MKKNILILIFIPLLVFSQEDEKRSFYLSSITSGQLGYGILNDKCSSDFTVPIKSNLPNKNYLIEDYILCNYNNTPSFFYKVFNGEMSYIVPVDKVEISEPFTDAEVQMYFSSMPSEKKQEYSEYLRGVLERKKKIEVLEAQLDEAERDHEIIEEGYKIMKNPIVVLEFSFPGDYGFYGFNVSISNQSKSRIKYISFNLTGFNDVDDVVYTLGGKAQAIRKGVGPVEPYEIGTWSFDNIWTDSTFASGRINTITVEYFNGTKKTFTNVGSLILPEDFADAVERVEKWEKENKSE